MTNNKDIIIIISIHDVLYLQQPVTPIKYTGTIGSLLLSRIRETLTIVYKALFRSTPVEAVSVAQSNQKRRRFDHQSIFPP